MLVAFWVLWINSYATLQWGVLCTRMLVILLWREGVEPHLEELWVLFKPHHSPHFIQSSNVNFRLHPQQHVTCIFEALLPRIYSGLQSLSIHTLAPVLMQDCFMEHNNADSLLLLCFSFEWPVLCERLLSSGAVLWTIVVCGIRAAKAIGDKRADVAEKGFGRPFNKVTISRGGILWNCNPCGCGHAVCRLMTVKHQKCMEQVRKALHPLSYWWASDNAETLLPGAFFLCYLGYQLSRSYMVQNHALHPLQDLVVNPLPTLDYRCVNH